MTALSQTIIIDRLIGTSAAASLVGLSVGGYRIECLLAEGGMGLVYQARHELIDRRFAIKVLRPEVAADAVLAKNFLAEAQTLSALKHPNIIDIVGFGVLPDGRQYMVTEFLEGATLEQEMAAGRLTLDRLLCVAQQTLTALSAAHSVEVIHRDLKPSNVFLARGSGGVETVKLLDFGLARQQPISFDLLGPGAPAPKCTVVAGTPEYIAPEQALGGAPDKSSDLYSFGVMLFEMATGRLPFVLRESETDRPGALLRAHTSEQAPSPEQVGATVPPGLTVLLQDLLAKSPAARPPSAEVVKQRLQSVRVAPIPLVTVRAAPRWRVPAAEVGLLALCLCVVVLLGSTFGSAAPVAIPAQAAGAEVLFVAEPPVIAPLRIVALAPRSQAGKLESKVTATRSARVKGAPAAPSRKRDCQPDERWRAAARVNLQELQQLAAGTPGRWAEFERLEPALSSAVEAATSPQQCEATEQQIRKLAQEWRT